MSVPAPALAKPPRPTVVVRLASASSGAAYLSMAFGLLLIFFPVSFPRLIVHSWQNGRLIVAMIVLTLAIDTYLYLHVAFMRSGPPSFLVSVCLGSMPLIIVVGLSFLLQNVVTQTLSVDLPHVPARADGEILADTYLSLVAAVFLPFLAIRFFHQLKSKSQGRRP